MGIYDIFAKAAGFVERAPWRSRLAVGAVGGSLYGAMASDSDQDVLTRMSKGLFVGGALGLGAGMAVRGLGVAGAGAERIGRIAYSNKVAAFKSQGWKAMMRPGTLALAGAAAGYALAPSGNRATGAAIGAGIGFAALPLRGAAKGWSMLGSIPGAQTGALIAAATIPVAASAAFGLHDPDSRAAAIPSGAGTMDYIPIDGGMKDRMIALNASGDIVLGLHGRSHG